jgi:5-formyltetrahydrofolate cyclo-ligase
MPLSHKQALRKHYQAKRASLSDTARLRASQALCTRIQALDVYQNASHIALYHAIKGEIDLHPLWRFAHAAGKICYMPVVNPHHNKTLLFLPATPDTPRTISALHIPEPNVPHHEARSPHDLDLMIMPLVAFDTHGTRLGTGGGYYDRTLAHQKPACILGVAYTFQRETFLTPEPWDIPLDGIVTEKTTYWSTS